MIGECDVRDEVNKSNTVSVNMECLKNNIINKLSHYKFCWEQLTGQSNNSLNSRILAMQLAIDVVKREFEKEQERLK